VKKPKPHECGLIFEGERWEAWHWSATPAQAGRDWNETLTRLTAARVPVRIKRVELGEIVEEARPTSG
jgi:hypothetical protein